MTILTFSFTNRWFRQRTLALLLSGLAFVNGCGGASYSAPQGPPGAQNASVTGQYNVVLTSTNGHGTINIYTNFTQVGTTLTGTPNTLVCPSNDLSQCVGGDAQVLPITPNGSVNGAKVTITVSFPNLAAADTVTMVGTVSGTDLAGSYTDTLGDAGNWMGSVPVHPFGPSPSVNSYSGTFNSTVNPLLIPPTISLQLGQNASSNLTGGASITNSPCISSLTLSGQAIGDAFVVTDAKSKAKIIALPKQPATPSGNSFTFTYKFEASAPNCAGDVGQGTLTITSNPWDY